MLDTSVSYLGFELKNPFLVGASPLVYDLETAKALECSGASGIVMHSLFEEQILRENIVGFKDNPFEADGIYPEANLFPLHPEAYLTHIERLKSHLSIPVIASINGIHRGSWAEFASQMESAGADAIELNLYFLPKNDNDSCSEVESEALQIIKMVRKSVSVPLSIKISPFFTNLPRFVSRVQEVGGDAVTLFNSFFQPDIDIDELCYKPEVRLSSPGDLLLRIRWIAALFGRTHLNISLSGGVHGHEDAIKGILSGATTVQVVSSLMREGPTVLEKLNQGLAKWMEKNAFNKVADFRGLLSFKDHANTEAITRKGYLQSIQDWHDS